MTAETGTDERKARLGRLTFRAWRRGFREADLVLGPFVQTVHHAPLGLHRLHPVATDFAQSHRDLVFVQQ